LQRSIGASGTGKRKCTPVQSCRSAKLHRQATNLLRFFEGPSRTGRRKRMPAQGYIYILWKRGIIFCKCWYGGWPQLNSFDEPAQGCAGLARPSHVLGATCGASWCSQLRAHSTSLNPYTAHSFFSRHSGAERESDTCRIHLS
jgi:hypothetical protein